MDPEIKDEVGFDLDAGVADIAGSLGLQGDDQVEVPDEPDLPETAETAEPEVVVEPPVVRAAPKSWSKEKHEIWSKLPPEAQEQIELREKQMLDGLETYRQDSGLGKQMREVVTPYRALLSSQGVDEIKAVQVLMNAHYKLSTLPPSERNNYFASLAQTYGVDLSQAQVQTDHPVDPRVKSLEDQVSKLTSTLTAGEQRVYEQHRTKISQDVNAFAADPAHPYFDEVADDIVVFINAGHSLDEAYARAVRANPVTYAKESARLQTEADKKLREKRTKEAKAAEQARSANVRSRDTRRAPTEPLGKMEDTMKETLAEINSRAH